MIFFFAILFCICFWSLRFCAFITNISIFVRIACFFSLSVSLSLPRFACIFQMMCTAFINKMNKPKLYPKRRTAKGCRCNKPKNKPNNNNSHTKCRVHLQSPPVWHSLVFGFYSLILFFYRFLFCFGAVVNPLVWYDAKKKKRLFICPLHISFTQSSIHFLKDPSSSRYNFSFCQFREKNKRKPKKFTFWQNVKWRERRNHQFVPHMKCGWCANPFLPTHSIFDT